MDQVSDEKSPLALGDRITGCLLGGACSDALGAPVELLKLPQIQARYGPEGITNFDEAYGVVGAITDDTQMTLSTVEGLIKADIRWSLKGICYSPGVVHHDRSGPTFQNTADRAHEMPYKAHWRQAGSPGFG